MINIVWVMLYPDLPDTSANRVAGGGGRGPVEGRGGVEKCTGDDVKIRESRKIRKIWVHVYFGP